jgi:hypothetical protein
VGLAPGALPWTRWEPYAVLRPLAYSRPPNHKSWIRPWLFHMSIQWLYTTQWLVTKWTNKPNKDPVVTFFNILGTRHSDFSLFKFLLHFDFCPAELISGFWVVMVFNTTFINILVISWWSVLLVEKIGVLGENHRSATIQMSLHNVVSSTPRYERDSNSQR